MNVRNRPKWTQQVVYPELLMCSPYFFEAWDPTFFWASVKGPLSIRSGTMSWWWTTRSRSWPPKPRTCGWAGRPPKGTRPTQEAVRSGVETASEMTSSPMDSMAFISGQVSTIHVFLCVREGDLLPLLLGFREPSMLRVFKCIFFRNLPWKWWERMLSTKQNFTRGETKLLKLWYISKDCIVDEQYVWKTASWFIIHCKKERNKTTHHICVFPIYFNRCVWRSSFHQN